MAHLRRTSIWIVVLMTAGAVAMLAMTADKAKPAVDDPEPHYVVLKFDGQERATRFAKVDIGASANEVVESSTVDGEGKGKVQKFPGGLKWDDIVLRRPVASDRQLWAWRQLVIDGGIERARKNGTITLLDPTGETVASWSFVSAWPARYDVSVLTNGSTGRPYETLTLAHEGFVRE